MSAICGEHPSDIWRKLMKSDRTDYKTATYLLLLDRKLRGLSLRISSSAKSHLKSEVMYCGLNISLKVSKNCFMFFLLFIV